MKKLFVLLMVLAIASTAAFAEVSISGDTLAGWGIIGASGGVSPNSTGVKTAAEDLQAFGVVAQGPTGRVRLVFQAQNEEGTFGARTRLVATNAAAANTTWVWWKPIDQFKVTVGGIDAGYGGMWSIGAQDLLDGNPGAPGDGGGGRHVFSGFNRTGGLLEFYLIDGLDIGINLGSGTLKESTAPLHIAAKYAVPDLLDVRLGFVGSANTVTATGSSTGAFYLSENNFWGGDYGTALFEAAVNVSAVSGVGIQVGAKIPVTKAKLFYKADADTAAVDTNTDVTHPLLITAAVDVTAVENLEILAHFYGEFGAKYKSTAAGSKDVDVPSKIAFDVDVQYNAGAFSPGVLFGMTSYGTTDAVKKALTTWNATPFVAIPFSGGSAAVGFKLAGSSVDNYKLGWGVQFGATFGF
jgi:hypothetical protein